ncbi:hypothetical protein I7V34_00495 [Bacillus sp. V3]|nr:hypothetical protein I7V34_00495 [Bacillus sp. V3]
MQNPDPLSLENLKNHEEKLTAYSEALNQMKDSLKEFQRLNSALGQLLNKSDFPARAYQVGDSIKDGNLGTVPGSTLSSPQSYIEHSLPEISSGNAEGKPSSVLKILLSLEKNLFEKEKTAENINRIIAEILPRYEGILEDLDSFYKSVRMLKQTSRKKWSYMFWNSQKDENQDHAGDKIDQLLSSIELLKGEVSESKSRIELMKESLITYMKKEEENKQLIQQLKQTIEKMNENENKYEGAIQQIKNTISNQKEVNKRISTENKQLKEMLSAQPNHPYANEHFNHQRTHAVQSQSRNRQPYAPNDFTESYHDSDDNQKSKEALRKYYEAKNLGSSSSVINPFNNSR